jgi:polysaccharide pyruvyl transferase WcaK-like protein
VLTDNPVCGLCDEFADRLWIEPVFWEHEPLLAAETFEKQLPRPHDCEGPVRILWAGLGTRPPTSPVPTLAAAPAASRMNLRTSPSASAAAVDPTGNKTMIQPDSSLALETPTRRRFLGDASLALGAASLLSMVRCLAAQVAGGRPPRILLVSGWQTVNIGDIGHTPGVLRLLDQHIPQAQITLWPNNIGDGVEEMLRRNFPKLTYAKSEEEVKAAFADNDFLLHGSGPSLVGERKIAQWRKQTGKPYGIYCITYASKSAEQKEIINGARFAFFRDPISLQFAKDQGLTCPIMEFGPDGAFAVDVHNDAAATKFLGAHGLEEGKFLCVIPRLRYTPYWKIRGKAMTAEDQHKHQRNEQMKEHDHAPLRDAICAVVRQTPMKVLICPEDQSQMAVGKEMLLDPLPDDVKRRVVWRDTYWLTDEAVSTYVRSAGLFGLEMHSPIMCVGNGVPAIVCRFKEQTTKGFMWRQIGLGDWLFDMDDPADVARLTPTVLSFVQDSAGTKAKLAKAQAFVQRRQQETMAVVKKNLPA